MTATTSLRDELDISASQQRVLIVESPAGVARRRWLEDRAQESAEFGARIFFVSCDFDLGGPWAGVNTFFSELFPEIQSLRPDLIERHARELVTILPQLRHSIVPRRLSLTDLASPEEKVRSYPADRAFRIVHGLVDLLESWKTAACTNSSWVLACDCYDDAGAMGQRFFRELMRRRGERLRIHLLAGVSCGKGDAVCASLSVGLPVERVAVDLPGTPPEVIHPDVAFQLASEIEAGAGNDRGEMQVNLADMVRLWRLAARPDKALHWRALGLDICNGLGIYEDALRYGDGLLSLAAEHAPGDDRMLWLILVKTLNCHLALQDVQASLKLAEEDGLKLAERHPEWRGLISYMIAMLYARYQKPRNLLKGEQYLERGLAEIEQANLPEDEFHFQSVFNRNGLAMVRNFQGRHQDAIELCRVGLQRLNAHLNAEKHRLHRSVLVYNIAQVYFATGSYAEAIEHYSVAISMDPNYSEYYNERANIFLQLGRLQEAHDDYLKAIDLSPPYFEVFTNLGQCYRRMGAMEKAVESYSRALDLEPNHLLALLGRAKAHEELGQVEPAITDYTTALVRDPMQWDAIASRGVMYYELGNFNAALADFNCAIDLKSDKSDLYQNRATVLADLGRRREAAVDIEAALKLNPTEEDKLDLQSRLEIMSRNISQE